MNGPARTGAWTLGRSLLALAMGVVLGAPGSVGAQGLVNQHLEGWRVAGEGGVNSSYFSVRGDPLQSIYRYPGWQNYGFLRLDLDHHSDLYRSRGFQFLGLVNDSDYRSPYQGAVPERVRLWFQEGLRPVAFRIDVGDSYAFYSQRVAQRPFKGIQLEMQSALGGAWRQSLQASWGTYRNYWRDLDPLDRFTGASYVVEAGGTARLGFNFVDYNGKADPSVFQPARSQRLFGVGGHVTLRPRSMIIGIDAELAHLTERRTPLSNMDSSPVERDSDMVFVQLTGGSHLPLTWRLLYEELGQFYRPASAPYVIAGRRSKEAHVAWSFKSGAQIRGRLQAHRDAWESANPLDTTTAGLSLGGPLLTRSLITNVDYFYQDSKYRNRVRDESSNTLRVDVLGPIRGVGSPRVRLFLMDVDDRTSRDLDRRIEELSLGLQRSGTLLGFRGNIEPRVVLRRVTAPGRSSKDWHPAITMSGSKGRHWFRFGYDVLTQNYRYLGPDVTQRQLVFGYRFWGQKNSFGIELERRLRRPDEAERTDTDRVNFFWTRSFDVRHKPTPKPSRRSAAPPPRAVSGNFRFEELRPGTDMWQLGSRMREAGYGEPAVLGGLQVFETAVFPDIFQRQQLVLQTDCELLRRAALIIQDYVPLPERQFARVFEGVKKVFIENFGPPTNVFERGEFDDNIAAGVISGDFSRILEWQRDGATIRFGIPRRLDQRPGIELQIGTDFPPVMDQVWSITDAPETASLVALGLPAVASEPIDPAAKPPPRVAAPVTPPVRTAMPVRDVATTDRPETLPPRVTARPARASLGRGDYAQAAREFRETMGTQGYTLQLEIVCQESSIREGVAAAGGSEDYFILPFPLKGRSCYRVFWGTYPTRASAVKAFETVPAFFREQTRGRAYPVRLSAARR